ncbi:MAG: BON domain-containing protein [Pirellulaceae bacterium]
MTAYTKPSSASARRDGPPPLESMSLQIERVLHGSSHVGLRNVRCKFADGVVILNGMVVSYYLKQVAQTIVGRQPQVRQVQNELQVARSDRRSSDRVV